MKHILFQIPVKKVWLCPQRIEFLFKFHHFRNTFDPIQNNSPMKILGASSVLSLKDLKPVLYFAWNASFISFTLQSEMLLSKFMLYFRICDLSLLILASSESQKCGLITAGQIQAITVSSFTELLPHVAE